MRTKVGVKAKIVDYFRNNLVSLDRFEFGEHKFFEKRLVLEPFECNFLKLSFMSFLVYQGQLSQNTKYFVLIIFL